MEAMARLTVFKTYKLFINGAFPRTESGRSIAIEDTDGRVVAHTCHASRKDLRDAVEAAGKARSGWGARTAYNRAQILYRMAEMLEGKSEEFTEAIRVTTGASTAAARAETSHAVDRLVCFAGWADKFTQVLGCNNPVAGPYYNFTVPEPTGVTVVVAPNEPSLLGLVTLIAPPLAAGCPVIAIGSDAHPLPTAIMGEVCATSDVPAGVVNLLTGRRRELLEHIADHRGIDAVNAANLGRADSTTLRLGAAENLKRVHITKIAEDDWADADTCESPWTIEPFVEMKTIWHPSGV